MRAEGGQRPIVVLVGPTAGGKTRLAIDLAKSLPGGGACLSADSMQVYREMDIGTAKPTESECAEAPHELIDLIAPDDDGFTVDTWLTLAEDRIAHHRSEGRWPIVVGGTNLYVQALLEGLYDGPAPDPALRSRLSEHSIEELRRRLLEVDPESAQRIHPNDRKRTIRAIEVFETTGTALSAKQQEWHRGQVREDAVIVGLDWAADAINPRINARVRAMMDAGLLDETRRLWSAGRLGIQAREALGYKQLIEHLEGQASLEDAVEQIKIRTRRFAKQQRTWLRRFRAHGRSSWIDPAEKAPAAVRDFAIEAVARA